MTCNNGFRWHLETGTDKATWRRKRTSSHNAEFWGWPRSEYQPYMCIDFTICDILDVNLKRKTSWSLFWSVSKNSWKALSISLSFAFLPATDRPKTAESISIWNCLVGTATRYGLDGPGIEYREGGGEIFRTRPDRTWGPPSLLYGENRVSFSGSKRPGRGVDHPHHLAPKLKKE